MAWSTFCAEVVCDMKYDLPTSGSGSSSPKSVDFTLEALDVGFRRAWLAKGETRGLGAEDLRFLTPDTGADVRRRVMA